MKVFALGALALIFGLGGCMHGAHHEHMEGMMGQHQANACPNASQAAHEPGDAATATHDQSAHEAQNECPPANAAQYQHDQPQN